MTKRLQDAAAQTLYKLHLPALLTRMAPGAFARATVSHGVFEERTRAFADVIDFIGTSTDFLTPSEYFDAVKGDWPTGSRAHGGVLMTFDDGLLSSYEFIMAELTPRDIRVVMFVPTAVVDMPASEQLALARRTRFAGTDRELREEQYLTIHSDHINTLVASGHYVMPHGHTHVRLASLSSASDLDREIAAPRHIIEQLTGRPADAFAFPYGDHAAVTRTAHARIATIYDYCFTAIGGRTTPRSNPLLLCRDNLDQTITVPEVARLLAGAGDPINSIKVATLRRRTRTAH